MKWKREKVPAGGEYLYPAYSARSGNYLVMAFRTQYKLDYRWALRVRRVPVHTPIHPVSSDCLFKSLSDLKELAEQRYEPDPLVAAIQEVVA